MLSNDSSASRGRACLTVDDLRGVTDSPALLELRNAGLTVTQLRVSEIEASELPPDFRITEFNGSESAERSDRVRFALERLHGEHRFDMIVFPARGGLGTRVIQAKRAGLAFENVTLTVRLDGNSQRDREAKQRWPSCFAEVETDYLERFAFENADVQMMPDDELAAFAKRNHWNVGQASSLSLPSTHTKADLHTISNDRLEACPTVTIAIAHYNLGRYLPHTLATLAAQAYRNFEVIAIDDGSTDAASVEVFESMRARYPSWQFIRLPNAGIGTTRNRCLELARGEYFIPVDADNLVRPDMIAKFVTAMQRNPDVSAMTCYFLAFDEDATDKPNQFLYAMRPAGGPHALAGIRNVYGDANAIFRTAALRAVNGYETDRGTSCEDWETFVKLVHAGHKLSVVPDHLFYYRHRPGGFSRSTNWFANHQRVLRQFAYAASLPPAESLALWSAMLGFQQEVERLHHAPKPRRHRIADRIYSLMKQAKAIFNL